MHTKDSNTQNEVITVLYTTTFSSHQPLCHSGSNTLQVKPVLPRQRNTLRSNRSVYLETMQK